MDLASVKKTVLPKYYKGVSLNHRGKFAEVKPYFFDTETCLGQVYTLFFQEKGKTTEVFYGQDLNYLNIFFGFLRCKAFRIFSRSGFVKNLGSCLYVQLKSRI